MIDVKKVLTLLACCCFCLTVATTAQADFVGVVTENKIDADTILQCGAAGLGLTVCNVSIEFDDDDDRLLSMAFSDLNVVGAAGGGVGADEAEIDFSVVPAFRGKGLGSKALQLTWRSACDELGVRRVRGVVLQANVPSARAFLNAGFTQGEIGLWQGELSYIFEQECFRKD